MPSSASILRSPPLSTLFPYTTLFRSSLIEPPKGASDMRYVSGNAISGYRYVAGPGEAAGADSTPRAPAGGAGGGGDGPPPLTVQGLPDRKSTRLNSSHLGISYAVFCFNPTLSTPIYTLSLHDALPI